MTDNVRSGDVDVKHVTLTSLDGSKTMSIKPQVFGISIYESVLSPVVTAEIRIYDAVDLLTGFPIIGEEKITIEFATAGFDKSVTYHLVINAIENQSIVSQNRAKTYIIRAASEEILKNGSSMVNKRYKTDSASVVKDILQSKLSTQKTVNLEPTKGTQDVLLTRLRPFQAIDMIRRRTVSKKYESATYVFFENQRGYNFCTVEKLMDDGKKNIGDRIFFMETATNTELENVSFRNILGFRNAAMFNNNSKLGMGGLRNTVRKLDLTTGAITNFEYQNQASQSKFKFATDEPIGLNTGSFEGKYGTEAPVTMIVPAAGDSPETFISDYAGQRQAFATKVAQNLYHMHVYGDSSITVGDVITIKLPKFTGTSGTQDQAKLVAGNFLVTRLRHIISVTASPDPNFYSMSMELVKGTYEDTTN